MSLISFCDGAENSLITFQHNCYFQRNDSSVLTLANSLWVKDQVLPRIKPSFINLLNSTYRALIQPLSNKNPEAGVNAWVRNATDGKIEKIISEFNKILL